ncbi:MAG TPA: type II toxin-antitoxin system VapC family toxin [Caulobacteraceae bacterium]|nr:type II toxin-antitoxin system VapC family toxin [Caulobacteraceae bacterium]
MILPDVDVLIYAFRADSPFHARCRAWLAQAIGGETRFGLSPLTLSAVVRVTTNRRAFEQPSTLDQAFDFCRYLLEQPNCQRVEPGPAHFGVFRRLCSEANVTGPDVTDAWYAALAIEHGCEWITMDRDFARFPGLRWRMPA